MQEHLKTQVVVRKFIAIFLFLAATKIFFFAALSTLFNGPPIADDNTKLFAAIGGNLAVTAFAVWLWKREWGAKDN